MSVSEVTRCWVVAKFDDWLEGDVIGVFLREQDAWDALALEAFEAAMRRRELRFGLGRETWAESVSGESSVLAVIESEITA